MPSAFWVYAPFSNISFVVEILQSPVFISVFPINIQKLKNNCISREFDSLMKFDLYSILHSDFFMKPQFKTHLNKIDQIRNYNTKISVGACTLDKSSYGKGLLITLYARTLIMSFDNCGTH